MKWLIGVLAALALLICVYAGSAFVALVDLVAAVRSGDAVRVMERTDLPRLRHSVVDQLVQAYLDRLGQNRPVRPFERMAVSTFGATIADDLANRLMTPQNLAVLLQSGEVRSSAENLDFDRMAALAEIDAANFFSVARRIAPIKPVEFAVRLGPDKDAGSVNLHYERFGWKLSGITLPAQIVARLVDRLPVR